MLKKYVKQNCFNKRKYKMINFDDFKNENRTKHNPK